MSKEVGQTVGFLASETPVTITRVDSARDMQEKALTTTLDLSSRWSWTNIILYNISIAWFAEG